jgi:hypothetical protein
VISLVVISLLFLVEAWLEEVVIELKHGAVQNYARLNRQEHFRSSVFAAILILSASVTAFFWEQDPWSLPAIVVARRIWFDYALIIFRDRPRNRYEGNDWWGLRLAVLFGKKGRIRELAVTIALTIFCIYKSLL